MLEGAAIQCAHEAATAWQKKTHATLSPRSAAAGSQAVHKIERRYCFLKRFILHYLLVL